MGWVRLGWVGLCLSGLRRVWFGWAGWVGYSLVGLGWAGLGWVGLGSVGLGWFPLRWAGLRWARLGWFGLVLVWFGLLGFLPSYLVFHLGTARRFWQRRVCVLLLALRLMSLGCARRVSEPESRPKLFTTAAFLPPSYKQQAVAKHQGNAAAEECFGLLFCLDMRLHGVCAAVRAPAPVPLDGGHGSGSY